MDEFDRKILACLQKDASLSTGEIASRVGLSTTPCWRRIRALEKSGVIRGKVMLVDASKIGLPTTVFVAVRTRHHNAEWLDAFAKAVVDIPEIVSLYRLSGDIDYLMRVVVPDIPGFDAVYKKLISSVQLSDVSSSFVMEEIKDTTVLPLDSAIDR